MRRSAHSLDLTCRGGPLDDLPDISTMTYTVEGCNDGPIPTVKRCATCRTEAPADAPWWVRDDADPLHCPRCRPPVGVRQTEGMSNDNDVIRDPTE